MRCVAENASATEQLCGLDGDDRPDAADLVSLGERLTGLRVQWRELHDLEARLRSELHASGIEPEVVPKRAVRDIATARPSWREHPVTARQLQILERLEAETDATFPAGATSTRGQAYDLIASLLAGNIPQAQIRDRLAGPLFMFGPESLKTAPPTRTPAPVATVPRSKAVPGRRYDTARYVLTRPLTARSPLDCLDEPDAEADAVAKSEVDRPDRFFSWADGHFKVKLLVALADLMTDRAFRDDTFVVFRAMLEDPRAWGELAHYAAEALWESRIGRPVQSPVTAEVTDTIVEARTGRARAVEEDFLDTVRRALDARAPALLDTVEQRSRHIDAIQDGIDQAAIVEVEKWSTRGRTAYDPADPLMLPQPDVDPQVAATISKVRNRTARQAIRDQWFHGVELARFEYTTEARHALIADVAVDPRLVDRVGGRRPDYLSAVVGDYARVLIAEAARGASPLRQSAAKALLGDHHPLPIEMFELAYAQWDRIHGPELTWDEAVAGEWTAWMTMQLRRDPLIGSWAGLPMSPRAPMIEIGVETAFAVVAEERPDLVDATSDIPRARLAAELRGNIIPNLPAPDRPDTSASFTDAGGYCALRLIDHVESERRYFPVLGWDYTLDGGASFTQCGHNARVALGAILEARDKPVPDWIERVYRPYAQADPTS
ncbi:hypothetical protein TVH25_18255 [Rhodococcus sp. 7Tela_A2]|uniref:hypothetical protein n=1 Tax=Rhodococcus sp. 7Tela_A2 TaxID=3093744 RepID=UPI003BB4EAA6